MNDIIVQFARLWGQHEALVLSAKDEDVSDELKGYDSEELLSLLTAWAEEFLSIDADDTVEFFEKKVDMLMSRRAV